MSIAKAARMLNEGPRRIAVPLGSRSYDVLIGDGLIEVAGRELRAVSLARRAMVVSDATVAPLYLDALRRSLDGEGFATSTHIVAPGEGSKSFATLAEVVDAILAAGLERGDVVVALGGGVVGDLSGFAAAIARRGTAFAQVPTSLLAQVDSAVGGKTGINTVRGKNLVGAFHQPILVLADTLALATLSERERRAGYAEIAKIGLIGDANFFARLEALGPRAPHEDVVGSIATAVAAKAAIVTEDEREAGRRALLNLGHTFAHAVERCAGYDGTIVHGEAVGLGLCLAFRLSVALDLCPQQAAQRVARHIGAVGLPTTFAEITKPLSQGDLVAAMAQDKKVKDGVVRFVLARGIGEAFVSEGVSDEALSQFLAKEGLPE